MIDNLRHGCPLKIQTSRCSRIGRQHVHAGKAQICVGSEDKYDKACDCDVDLEGYKKHCFVGPVAEIDDDVDDDVDEGSGCGSRSVSKSVDKSQIGS